jgi:N-acetylglucosaminyldiphosphoundecaprenol N-acetyl-beta-D-mannosaminyltransferase
MFSMNIFNTKISACTKNQFTDLLKDSLRKTSKTKVSKINAEFLLRTLKDKEISKLLDSFDLNIVDGRGVLLTARYLTLPISNNTSIRTAQAIWQMIYCGAAMIFWPKYVAYPLPEAIPGVEAFRLTMKVAAEQKAGVFLFGCSQEILEKATDNIKRDFPDLKISGRMNGYDYQKDDKVGVVDEINKTDAKILVVSLGVPRQEYWINENISKLKNVRIAVGEGGTLDRVANPLQMSPKFINRIGLEWLWRLFFNASKTEGRNRFQRTWNAVPLFIYQVVKWKIKHGQTKI